MLLFGVSKFVTAMMAGMQADMARTDMARTNLLLRASPSSPYRSRSAGDLAHKRWKRARAAGRR
jgi:hypothetical protein